MRHYSLVSTVDKIKKQQPSNSNLSNNIISMQHLQDMVERDKALGKINTTTKTQASPTINPAYQYKNKDEDLGTMSKTVKDTPTPTASGAGLGAGGYGGGYAPMVADFKPSESYLKAMEYTNSLLEQLSSGRTSYTDKVQSMLSAIENHAPFQYDMNTDTLFQNALQSAMNSGQIAMQDTMGQASALTGGYGSSYAQSVGNQAYNNMIQGAYEQLPDYYNLALGAYDREMQNLYNQLDMYSKQDQIEYDRLANAYSANAQATAGMYDREYNDYYNKLNFDSSQRQYASDLAYKYAQANRAQANWEKEFALEQIKAQQKADTEANEPQYDKLTDKYFQTGVGLYNKYGDEVGSPYREWVNNLPLSEEDTQKIMNYVKGNGDMAEYSVSSYGNIFKQGDNKYVDQWGNTFDYAELVARVGEEEAKKIKKKG